MALILHHKQQGTFNYLNIKAQVSYLFFVFSIQWVTCMAWKQLKTAAWASSVSVEPHERASHLCWPVSWCWAQSGTSSSWSRPPAWRSIADRWAACPPAGCRAARTASLGSRGLTGEPERRRMGGEGGERERQVEGNREVYGVWVVGTAEEFTPT